jgi:hypothetical protein
MFKIFKVLLIIILFLPELSCRKVNNYFRDPETELLVETLHTTVIAGYAANIAMNVMEGWIFSNVTLLRSNPGFPCTTIMVVNTENETGLYSAAGKVNSITIAGLWPDANTAILTLLFTDYHAGTSTFDLIGIETIPVIREGDYTHVVLASMDIRFNPDQESMLQLNLNTLEVESEFLRIDMPRPTDVYVAVLQNAYFIDVNNHGTNGNLNDDSYTVTGGGQLVEVAGNEAEIVQQAMVDVKVSPDCSANPVDGMALIRVTGIKGNEFPELGTAILQCSPDCKGTARVFVATGIYIRSNGQNVTFQL